MTSVEVLNGGVLKEDDTSPELRVKLFDGEDPFNLDGYDVEVTIKRTDSDSSIVDSASASVSVANRGIVTYSWQSGDTDESGTYLAEFVATSGSDQITFPNDEYTRLYIEDHL